MDEIVLGVPSSHDGGEQRHRKARTAGQEFEPLRIHLHYDKSVTRWDSLKGAEVQPQPRHPVLRQRLLAARGSRPLDESPQSEAHAVPHQVKEVSSPVFRITQSHTTIKHACHETRMQEVLERLPNLRHGALFLLLRRGLPPGDAVRRSRHS